MSRRIEIELTSARDDGSWTWRAAGAKQPKGELAGGLLYEGAKVGDVVRAEAEFLLDGIEILSVLPPKGAKPRPDNVIEVIGSRRSEPGVTTTLVEKRGRGGRDRGDRGERGDRPPRGDRPDRGPRGERPDRGPRPERGERRDRPPRDRADARPRREGGEQRPRREPPPTKPKPKRLKARRVHRDAVVASLPEEQKPIAEQLLRGGIPGVRQAVERQNEAARAEGRPEIKADALVGLAEQLLPRLKTAEWRDRAEAALAGIEEIDLRDIRSVVVAADGAARDEETRALAGQLREGLAARVEQEHREWLADIATNLQEGRTVRALRLSSRPPKAGAPLPPDLAERLVLATSEALAADVTSERWATVLDAVSYSPIRSSVVPAGIPEQPGDELLATVRKLADRVPAIAALFGIEAPAPASRQRRRGRPGAAPGAPPAATPEADATTEQAEPEPQATTSDQAEPTEPEATSSEQAEPEATTTAQPEPEPEPEAAEAPEPEGHTDEG
ncbi:MAG: hypothetical protein MUE34_05635 [Acidimicrobiales bacterium]|nr:hypothetical protein [Acidimicrobiales bacterium]